MGWFSKIFGSNPAVAAGEGAAAAVVNTVGGLSAIVEKWAPTAADKQAMSEDVQAHIAAEIAAARSFNPTSVATDGISLFINVVTDAITRLIRPVVTVVFLGGMFGWWTLETRSLDPFVVTWGQGIMAFWFGTRAVFKDIPSFIKDLKGARK